MQETKRLTKEWIATILSGVLRADDVMYELEHFISVQAGGYTQEEADAAMDSFNNIIDSIADTLMLEIRLEVVRVRRQMIKSWQEADDVGR
tara:strand:+ start:408 stop:680 length:273 start_codon:yes stop_codon:yes gene_type:complete